MTFTIPLLVVVRNDVLVLVTVTDLVLLMRDVCVDVVKDAVRVV